ncbi:MAG TPA: helix-turn-helix domain-containing protein [Candidatus Oscillibacter excrementigallinarum]|uniref:Helix-turn-helix domain-containing protein n=1 Tax=Candidatus Oscillibacter excrementigallinarum TaxID=2838716 RepID=A0A9D2LHN1_9FIRM|nr:helix-turn-helix domain-containing protein [Candidatus Oscillibacter excrementigallinarum]
MIKFDERLKELRKEKGVTQREIAEFLGIKTRPYQNYESGDRRPDYEKLVALADYFDVTTDYLLGRTDRRG